MNVKQICIFCTFLSGVSLRAQIFYSDFNYQVGLNTIDVEKAHSSYMTVQNFDRTNHTFNGSLGLIWNNKLITEAEVKISRMHNVSGLWYLDNSNLDWTYWGFSAGGLIGYRFGQNSVKVGMQLGFDSMPDYILVVFPIKIERVFPVNENWEIPLNLRLDISEWDHTWVGISSGFGIRYKFDTDG